MQRLKIVILFFICLGSVVLLWASVFFKPHINNYFLYVTIFVAFTLIKILNAEKLLFRRSESYKDSWWVVLTALFVYGVGLIAAFFGLVPYELSADIVVKLLISILFIVIAFRCHRLLGITKTRAS